MKDKERQTIGEIGAEKYELNLKTYEYNPCITQKSNFCHRLNILTLIITKLSFYYLNVCITSITEINK